MDLLQQAEEAIGKVDKLIPAAERIIEAYKLLVLREAYALVREANDNNKSFLVLPKEQCDKITVALHPHVFSDIGLVKKGYDHFLIKRMPVFEEGAEVPTLEEMRVHKKK